MSNVTHRDDTTRRDPTGPRGPQDVPFLPEEGHGAATVFTCALCGKRFTHGGLVCGGCVLASDCSLVKCPNCGYQFPRDSRIVAWVRRLLGPRRGAEGPSRD